MKMRLFIAGLLFILFLSQGIALADYAALPLPEATTKEGEQEFKVNNIESRSEFYQSRISPREIAAFYKENLPAQGFILVSENKAINVLAFSHPRLKESLNIAIEEANEQGFASFSITRSGADLLKAKESIVGPMSPTSNDAPGRDLPGIPRYPGAIRMTTLEQAGVTNVSYRTINTQSEVASFYEKEMPGRGWKRLSGVEEPAKQKAAELLGGDKRLAGSAYLLFEKGDTICGIMVIAAGGASGDCGSPGGCPKGSEGSFLSMGLFPKGE